MDAIFLNENIKINFKSKIKEQKSEQTGNNTPK